MRPRSDKELDGASTASAQRAQAQQETMSLSGSSFQGLAGADDSAVAPLASGMTGSGKAIAIGQAFGRYRIEKVLGSGSMGSVFLARDCQLDRQVAIKMPRLDHDPGGEIALRLHREARAAAVLSHPNICPVYDVGEHSGTSFIAMGFVPGKSLSAYLASGKAQPEREVAKVIRKAALALEEAHEHGILHRDLKPSNIMIDKRGEPIIMDFGVACWYEDQGQTRLTQQGAIVGTPAYMSPEQINGQKLGPTSDVYSLGVVLYQLLTGRCPFEGTVINVINKVLNDTPTPVSQLRPDLSTALVEICERAMDKDPARRFPSMREFAKALTAFLNSASPTVEMRTLEQSGAAVPSQENGFRPGPRKKVMVRDSEMDAADAGRQRSLLKRQLPAAPRPSRKRRRQKKVSTSNRSWLPIAVGALGATVMLGGLFLLFAFWPRSRAAGTATVVSNAASIGVIAGSSEKSLPLHDSVTAKTTAVLVDARAEKPNSVSKNPIVGAPASSNQAKGSLATASMPPGLSEPMVGLKESLLASPSAPKSMKQEIRPASPLARREDFQPGLDPGVQRKVQAEAQRHKPQDQESFLPAQPGGENRGRQQPQFPLDFRGPSRGETIEQYFREQDRDGDEQLDPSELPLHVIVRADANKDGVLSLKELRQAFKRMSKRLFSPPTAAERHRLPGPPLGGPENGPPRGGPQGGGSRSGF